MISLILFVVFIYVMAGVVSAIINSQNKFFANSHSEKKRYARRVLLSVAWPYLVFLKLKELWEEADFNNKRGEGKVH